MTRVLVAQFYSNQNTPSTSASGNTDVGFTSTRKQSDRDCSHPRKQMTDKSLSQSLTPFRYSLFNSTSFYAHLFISKGCNENWAIFCDDDLGSSNEKQSAARTKRDCCRSLVSKIIFKTLSKVRPENLATNGAPFIVTVNVGRKSSEIFKMSSKLSIRLFHIERIFL